VHGNDVLNHFLNPHPSEIIFHFIVILAPISSTITAYLINERSKLLVKTQLSEEKYSELFHKSNDAIFIHDLHSNIIDINKMGIDLFGYSKNEFLNLKIPDLHPDCELEISRKAFEMISKDGFVNFEIDFKKKNGEIFPAEVSSSLFRVDGKDIIQGIVRDTTERKDMFKKLNDKLNELENFYDMAVGRELKMKELKKEISRLKNISSKYSK
jgi:PAS domain S-box-containing protein